MMQPEVKQSEQPAIQFQPYAPGYDEDPSPVHEQLRQREPIHYWPDGHGWVISKYNDVLAVMRDKRFTPNREHWELAALGDTAVISPELHELNKHGLFALAEKAHARVRKLVSPALTPRAIERLRP